MGVFQSYKIPPFGTPRQCFLGEVQHILLKIHIGLTWTLECIFAQNEDEEQRSVLGSDLYMASVDKRNYYSSQ